jgi:hypothetical protein
MNKSNVLSAFNTHLIELFKDINSIIPNNMDLMAAETSLLAIKKANPRLVVTVWKHHIADKYKNDIIAGNISFFLEKDYSEDLLDADEPSIILEKINLLRKPIQELGEENLNKTIGYLQNLTKLCELYHTN